jgi:hypothetical protein
VSFYRTKKSYRPLSLGINTLKLKISLTSDLTFYFHSKT